MKNYYYVQDTRSYVGPTWWKQNHHGYTTSLLEAHRWTIEELAERRLSDHFVPWPTEVVHELIRPIIDMQQLRRIDRTEIDAKLKEGGFRYE